VLCRPGVGKRGGLHSVRRKNEEGVMGLIKIMPCLDMKEGRVVKESISSI